VKAITVKFYGQTETKPARVKAEAEGGHSLTVTFHSVDSNEDPYRRVARLLAIKLGWKGVYCGGTLPNLDRVYVPVDQGPGENWFSVGDK
jgi:hypothetical protein